MSRSKQAVIIVAGGKGVRMGKEIPKQFITIGNKPILMWTLEKFYNYNSNIQIVLVLPENQIGFWEELCFEYKFVLPHSIAHGGETRFHSVQNGLGLAKDCDLVGVHDGVRPFVSVETIERCFNVAEVSGAAIPVMPSIESVREVDDNGQSVSVPREKYRMVQTPQVFQQKELFKAYDTPWQSSFTDDASVMEAAGYPIALVEGNVENIKITSPFDLLVAEAIVNS